MSLPNVDIKIEQTEYGPAAVILFDRTMEVLSSCILNGGPCDTRSIIIMQVPSDYSMEDPVSDAKNTVSSLGLPDNTVVFMTAAEVDYVLARSDVSHNGYDTIAIATAGLANHVVAGEELTDWEAKRAISQKRHEALLAHCGTINTIGIIAEPLTDSAKVNSFIAMTEAKTAAMHDMGYKETGTTSDAIAIVCPKEGNVQEYAGTGFGFGLSLAKAVRSAVRKSLIKRGDFSPDIPEGKMEEMRRMYL